MRYFKANESGTMLYDSENNMKLVLASDVDIDPSGLELASKENDKKISEAVEYLNKTDWYLVRKMETGKEVPSEIIEKRANARLIADNFNQTSTFP